MAPTAGRGRRGRGTAERALTTSSSPGRRCPRGGASGPHHAQQRLIVTLHVRAPQPVRQLPAPESTLLSTESAPTSSRLSIARAAGQRERPWMAPVRDPNNVDGMRVLSFSVRPIFL